MKQETEKKRICVTISKEEHALLSRLAKESARTPTGYLRWVLLRHFQEHDKG